MKKSQTNLNSQKTKLKTSKSINKTNIRLNKITEKCQSRMSKNSKYGTKQEKVKSTYLIDKICKHKCS